MAVITRSQSAITVNEEVIQVDQQLLFQRLLATTKNYKLSTVPVSLFGEDFFMRKANKQQLGDAIMIFVGRESIPEDTRFVIDGGWLLYRVPNWKNRDHIRKHSPSL